jgi:hypothetical protein
MTRYHHAEDGEWLRPKPGIHKMRCCDCGLTHQMEYRIVDGRVEFRAVRDRRATAAVRRWMSKNKLRDDNVQPQEMQ